MLEGTQGTRRGLLTGKTVWIVEPERFSAHALETALIDLRPDAIVHVGSVNEAYTRLERVGPGGAPQLAVIDFTGEGDARALAGTLNALGATVVRTVSANGFVSGGTVRGTVGRAAGEVGGRTSGKANEMCGARVGGTRADATRVPLGLVRDVPRPYAPADVTRAIARHYGLA